MELTKKLLSGEVVRNSRGTFYFDRPGNHMGEDDEPHFERLHREGAAAIIDIDGNQFWYRDGKQHREDGPAVVYADGTQFWYCNDELHRENGPAVVCVNGRQEWWLNGERLAKG